MHIWHSEPLRATSDLQVDHSWPFLSDIFKLKVTGPFLFCSWKRTHLYRLTWFIMFYQVILMDCLSFQLHAKHFFEKHSIGKFHTRRTISAAVACLPPLPLRHLPPTLFFLLCVWLNQCCHWCMLRSETWGAWGGTMRCLASRPCKKCPWDERLVCSGWFYEFLDFL